LGKLSNWIDNPTVYRYVLHTLLLLNFPVSRAARWRYVWGGALALMFLVELVTGTLLMTVYSPSEAAAWGSVQYLETKVSWGWFVRGVHHFTSHMILMVILLHALLVVLTALYRKPKEFTYWSGLVVGVLVLAMAISGNPLPWDQKG
jgi:ubiquinol-cytochrome c reductase cytochrome b subunit